MSDDEDGSPRAGSGPRAVGEYGERLACRYLEEHGYVVLDRNWRCPHGEIDIVARDADGRIVVVEVKARRGRGYGDPLEAVVARKVLRLRRLTAAWLEAHPEHRGGEVRIDVIGVLHRGRGPVELRHVRGVGR